MIFERVLWSDFKAFVSARLLQMNFIENDTSYIIRACDSWFAQECLLDKAVNTSEVSEFETNFKTSANKKIIQEIASMPSFGSKTFYFGNTLKKLYSRFTGQQFAIIQGANTCDYTVTHAWVKMVGIELIAGELGDTASLKVIDTAQGTYSGVPNYVLNQFGFEVNVAKDYYARASQFDSDLYPGMIVRLEYNSISAKTIGVNYLINEVKS